MLPKMTLITSLNILKKTWIGAVNSRIGVRMPPKFSLTMWNRHSAILARQDLTTNSSEGTNSAIKISVSRNANIWNIMKQINNEDSLVALKLRDAAIGYNPESGKKHTKTSKAGIN